MYYLDIRNKQSQKLAGLLNLTVKEKHTRMLLLLAHKFKIDNRTFDDKFLPNIVNGELLMEDRCGRMSDLVE